MTEQMGLLSHDAIVELRLFWVLHDGIGLILTCYGLVFYIATYYIHSLRT
ncbi:hypothetical protein DAEQUDRAFT_728143 [Daedalea quercina L-15889]|uniref:Uncharacterized protein n=1 Tax=Daedalea quercina L-15889 TaxID=1314783 RepID=A0A165PKW7_9APHY|nr:hypothetical protein DAEQUDRAFT_728143 [Daedalea quercina L-15889]